jgi:hypothetical protein
MVQLTEDQIQAVLRSATAAAGNEDGGFWDIDLPHASELPNFFGSPPATAEETVETTARDEAYGIIGITGENEETGEPLIAAEQFRQMATTRGLDIEAPNVVNMIALVEAMGMTLTEAATWIDMLAGDPANMSQAAATPYSNALEESGFGTDFSFPTSPGAQQLGAFEGISPTAPGPGVITQPDTGWQLFPNGALVNKAHPDPMQAVIFKPGSNAPGSSWWYDATVTKWSPEKVSEWRSRLTKMGYLAKEDEDTKGLDMNFRMALTQYHTYRYYNNGKAVALDNAAGGPPNPTITPKDFQDQIRNNVRQQFLATFGDEPSEAELASWTRFTLAQATSLQMRYMKKGLSEGEALSMAQSQAGEQTADKLWTDPVATFQREGAEENTKLHDALQRAIFATEGLLG